MAYFTVYVTFILNKLSKLAKDGAKTGEMVDS